MTRTKRAFVSTLSTSLLLVMVASPLACGTKAIRDLCDDNGQCVSDPLCPMDPPATGIACPDGMAEGALCFYCTENNRLDAQQYECGGNRFVRRANLDCGG